MQLSYYVKSWPASDHPGFRILYSTKNTALTLVPEEEMDALEQGRIDPELEPQLAELGLLVPDREAEKEEMQYFLEEINGLNPGVDLAVVLGLACNFACVYCYEGSLKEEAAAMDEATADQVVRFAQGQVGPGRQKLRLDFYGGETLLYLPTIKRITSQLKPWADEQGIEFVFSLVTNGSLLTPEVVEELLDLGLLGAKVTLDGPPEVHNRLRPYKSGRPSFDDILANVRKCCDMTRITLGGNFTRDTYEDFPRLIDILIQEGLTQERLDKVAFGVATQPGERYGNPEFTTGCASLEEEWMAAATLLLREACLGHGFRSGKVRPQPCMVDIATACTVNHDGGLFKCPALIGHEEFRIGDVWQGMGAFHQRYHLGNWQEEERCRECVYLPLCFGGCREMRFQRHGDMNGVECKEKFLDRTLEEMIKQDIRYNNLEG